MGELVRPLRANSFREVWLLRPLKGENMGVMSCFEGYEKPCYIRYPTMPKGAAGLTHCTQHIGFLPQGQRKVREGKEKVCE